MPAVTANAPTWSPTPLSRSATKSERARCGWSFSFTPSWRSVGKRAHSVVRDPSSRHDDAAERTEAPFIMEGDVAGGADGSLSPLRTREIPRAGAAFPALGEHPAHGREQLEVGVRALVQQELPQVEPVRQAGRRLDHQLLHLGVRDPRPPGTGEDGRPLTRVEVLEEAVAEDPCRDRVRLVPERQVRVAAERRRLRLVGIGPLEEIEDTDRWLL